MTSRPISRASLLAGALLLLGAAAPYETRLEANVCQAAAPALIDTLGRNWAALSKYAQNCPVAGPDGRIALSVAVMRIDRMQADHWFDTHHDPRIPLPVLLDASRHVIGKLPEGFPADLPGALRVTFKGWRGGMPTRIDQYEAFETALPPHALAAQIWEPANHRYRQLPDEP